MYIKTFFASGFLYRLLPVYLFLYLTFSACNQHVDKGSTSNIKTHHAFVQTNVSGENAEVSKLRTQVLALHDEAMLVLDDIMELRHKAKTRLHILDTLPGAIQRIHTGDEKLVEEKRYLELVMKELNQAHTLMMDWMRKYDSKMENMTTTDKIAYLKKEKGSIESVRKKILETIDTCKLLLKYLP